MSGLDRRSFIGSVAATTFTIVPRPVLGGAGYVAPSDKIALAHIGMGTQGFRELEGLLAHPQIQVVAVCDPNRESYDYVEWSKYSIRKVLRKLLGDATWGENQTGCPGGREIGQQVVNAWYAKQKGSDFKGCSAYADFRELLEKEKDVDAVKIMTPDHLHATISTAAMKRGKHVMMHKPLSNRMHEARLVVETARKANVATHFLPYASGAFMRTLLPCIKAGAIGKLREVHNWTSRPFWPQYQEIPEDKPPVPAGFDWDLWLGPEQDRPYHPHYTHTVFRGWYDFGGGSMADMGIYSLWAVFTALGLGAPLSAEPFASHYCSIVDHVSRRVNNDFSFPDACTIRFKFAARGDDPPLDLFWYDGGMKPRLPAEMEAAGEEPAPEGVLFIGDEGKIIGGFHGDAPRIYPKSRSEFLPKQEGQEVGALRRRVDTGLELFVKAAKGGDPSPGSFANAGPISDTVNLAGIALRTGKKVLFDSENMKITNVPEAGKYLYRQYRKGWELS